MRAEICCKIEGEEEGEREKEKMDRKTRDGSKMREMEKMAWEDTFN